MTEKRYEYTLSDEKTIEMVVNTKFCAINHMILNKEERLPVHKANSNVHMIVVRGRISLKLNDQEVHRYSKGSILEIPYGTKMDVFNNDKDIAELFVVKAPSPQYYKELIGNK